MWKWIEEVFEYDWNGTNRYDKYGPVCPSISDWLNQLESEKGYIIIAAHFVPLENNYILAILKVEFSAQGKGDDNEDTNE